MEATKIANKQLKNLYESYYSDLSSEMFNVNIELDKENRKSEKGTNPLLLKVNDDYVDADIKIMFFGQETNMWLGERNNGAFLGEIQPVIDLYHGFYIDEFCYKYGGQFWNGISRLKKIISNKLPEKKIGFLWNNVVKIGRCDKGFPTKINSLTNKYFNVIPNEIEITKPDIIIFLSGPNYDSEIRKIFGDFKTKAIGGYSTRQLCKIESANLPNAFRTYDPNFLWRNGIDNFFNVIADEIKTTNP